MHNFALKASLSALAAANQGKYKEISNVFMQNYNKLNSETIKAYAKEIGLDMNKFEKDLNDPSINEIINQDINIGRQANVRGIPAIFINGRVVKNYSIIAMSEMIEKELKKIK
jgi:protein-disulfide isomerase